MKRITIVLVLAGLPLCGCKGGKDYTSETEKVANVYNLITGKLEVDKPKFPLLDLLADVDAKNINTLYPEYYNLSFVLKKYYGSYAKHRFTLFVNGFGGIDEFSELVYSYTHGNEFIKHWILRHHAEDTPVTKEEADALHLGFIHLMEDMINEENN